MADKITLEESFIHAQKVTKQWAKSFYFASKFLSKEKRNEIYAIYAFCRYTDNIVDENEELNISQKHELLDKWEDRVILAIHSGDSNHIDLKAFVYVLKKYKIEESLPLELIAGMEMDLTKTRFKSQQELERYCYLVASVVGLMMIPVLGCDDYEKAKPYAIKLGKAMQITNILRDVNEDYQRGRIYLPQNDLQKFGYSEIDISEQLINQNFYDLMKYYILLAKNYYQESQEGLKYLSKTTQKSIKLASKIYESILIEIEKQNYNIYEKRASVSDFNKLKIVFANLLDQH